MKRKQLSNKIESTSSFNSNDKRIFDGLNGEKITVENHRIELNEFNRNLVVNQNIFKEKNFYFKIKEDNLISLEVTIQCLGLDVPTPKGAIVQLGFFDENFKSIYLNKVEGLSKSTKVGLYSYISLFPEFQTYGIKFKSPPGVSAIKVSVKNWAIKNESKISVQNIIISEIDNDQYKQNIPPNQFLPYFENIEFEGSKLEIITKVQHQIQHLRNTRKETPATLHKIYEAAFYALKLRSVEDAYEYGLEALNFLFDPVLENNVVRFLRALGHINLPLTIRDSSIQNKRATNNIYYKRLVEESKFLKEEFEFSEKDQLTYSPFRNSFYLLHNSLPYNSGGYATRTHGLLSSMNGFGEHKCLGVSRPGYPNDHGKHISKSLPSYIPPSNVVDNVKYFRLSPETRSSTMLVKKYHEIYVKEIMEMAKFYKPFVIHAASNSRNGLAAVEAARRLGVKSIYEVRGLWELTRLSRQPEWENSDQYKLLEKHETEACKGADVVFTLTRALKKILIERGVNGDKIHLLPNAVNVDKFIPTKRDESLFKQLGFSEDEIIIGYIGSVVNYEGLDDLIEALSLIKDVVKFKFLLVGDGAYYDKVKEAVEKFGMKEKIVLTGRVPHEDVTKYYSLVDIAPFPRRPYKVCEAVSPLKPFEALAMQKTVLVSSCDALVEIIEHDKTGYVFEKGDVQDMANKLKVLIEDKQLRTRLALSGYEWVKENRDWKSIAEVANSVYSDLFNEVLDEYEMDIREDKTLEEENLIHEDDDIGAEISKIAKTSEMLQELWGSNK